MRHLLILCASVAISASACAEATSSSSPTPTPTSTIVTPNVPSDAPYIVLSANHDEPNGYGFCMDTYGPGQTDLMQTHSCKPAKADAARDYAGHDTRFEYNPDTWPVAITHVKNSHLAQKTQLSGSQKTKTAALQSRLKQSPQALG